MIQAIYPTTQSQQGFVLASLAAAPGDALFVEQFTLPLLGPLDIERFRETWRALVAAHDILRTGFSWNVSDEPRQVVLEDASLDIAVFEAAGEPPEVQRGGVAEILEAQRTAPFDLRRPPLIRLALQRRGPADHVLVWTHHHAILDGWSQMLLLEEMLRRYHGDDPDAAPVPFGNYAEHLAGRPVDATRAFWREALAKHQGAPVAPAGGRAGNHRTMGRTVSAAAMGALADAARRADVTVAGVVIALWGLAVCRLHGRGRTTIGVTVGGRLGGFPGAAEVIGPFVNTLPLVVRAQPDMSLAEHAREVQQALARMSGHGEASAGQIHRWLELPGGEALFDTVVAVSNYPQPDVRAHARALHADLAGMETFGGRTQLPISLVVTPLGDLDLRLVRQDAALDTARTGQLMDFLSAAVERFGADAEQATVGQLLDAAPIAPLDEVQDGPGGHEPPGTTDHGSLEAVVAQAFAGALGAPSVGLDEHFIARGGHSLLAVELLRVLRQRLNIDLTLQDLLVLPTPRAVAQRIRECFAPGAPPPEPLPAIVGAGPSDEPFALSEIQEAYWVGRRSDFDLGAVDSHLYGEVEVGDLDVDRLGACWRRLILRHEMLRAIVTEDGRQVVLPQVPDYEIAVADLRDLSDPEPALMAMRSRLAHARRSTAEWPLFTIEAARLRSGAVRLFLSFDLLIGDASTWKILYAEVAALYSDPDAALEPLSITFRDYVQAIGALEAGDAFARDRAYWRARMADFPPAPEFPLLVAPGSCPSPEFRRREMRLHAHQAEQLRRRAAGLGVTPSALLLTLFAEVLCRFTNQGRVLINLTVFNRLQLHPDVNRLVGDFTSLSLTEVEARAPEEDLADAARRTQRRLWEDLDHRLYSGLRVLRDLAERSGQPRAAHAPVVFTSTLESNAEARAAGAQPWTLVHGIGQTPQVLLDYQVFDLDGGVAVIWDAVEALFPQGYLDAAFEAHRAILTSVLETGEGPRPEARRAPLEPHRNSQRRLQDPFVDWARRDPGRLAVASAGHRVTYGQLHNAAVAIAGRLNAEADSQEMVAVAMGKGWEQIAGVLGALFSGRAFVPLDPQWPADRVRRLLERTRACAVLASGAMRTACGGEAAPVIIVDEALLGAPDAPVSDIPPCEVGPDDLAYVIFTSGSTGEPKGVMIQHRAALNTILDINERFGVGPEDRTFSISPLVFDLAIYDVFGLLAAGGAIILPAEGERANPTAWLARMAAGGVTLWNSVPSLMGLLIDAAPEGHGAFDALRLCLLSGDWIPLNMPDAVRAAAPRAQVVSLGGATEGSIWSIYYPVGRVEEDWTSIPYGFPLAGQSVEVLGPGETPSPLWTPGDIYIGGWGVALGYWDAPDLTARAFVEDRFGRRLYRTGDRGRLRPDGAIEFLGRGDGQVKINGYRIELAEVEAALSGAPGVDAAAVVALGERENRRLAAFYTGSALEAELRTHLAKRLPAYMIPTTLRALATLPLSPVGKVDRGALSRLEDSGAAAAAATAAGSPREDLLEAVRAFLGRDVGPAANLVSAGLTSIDAIRLLNAVERRLGWRPNLEAFYREATVIGLQRQLEESAAEGKSHVRHEPAPRAGPWRRSPQLEDPVEREAYRATLQRRPDPLAAGLLPPRRAPADAFGLRRSAARFGDAAVPLASFGRMLEALSAGGEPTGTKYLYPSAGGLYGLDVFVHVRPTRVESLAGGLYRYDPITHDLAPVVLGIDFNALLHPGYVNQQIAETAAFTIFMLADPARATPIYGPAAEELAYLDAGYAGHVLCQHAQAAGLALCPLHGFAFERVSMLFGPAEGVLLHLLAGGAPVVADPLVSRWLPSDGLGAAAACHPWPEAPPVLRCAPLSPGQERLLDSEFRTAEGAWPPDGSAGRLRPIDTNAVLIEGGLDPGALQQALGALAARQAALRTTVRFRSDGEAIQVVTPPRPFELRIEDAGPAVGPPMAWVAAHGHASAAPTGADLFRATLLRFAGDRSLLLLDIHHLVSDGWSIGVLFRDLSELYDAAVEQRPPRLAAITRSFDDYAREMRLRRESGAFSGDIQAWREALRDPAVTLVFPNVSGADRAGTVDDLVVRFDLPLVEALRAVSAAAASPGGLSGPLFAAVAMAVSEVCGTEQIDLGCMAPARLDPDAEALIGFFSNTVIIRHRVEAEHSVAASISRANASIAGALGRQDAPIQDVVAELRRGGALGAHQPPFQVSIALNDLRREPLALAGAASTTLDWADPALMRGPRPAASSVKLRWLLEERPDGLRGTLTYARDCFSEADVVALVDRLTEILQRCADPQARVGDIVRRRAAVEA